MTSWTIFGGSQEPYTIDPRASEVVPTSPLIVGFTDASGLGMGGTYFIPTPWLTPEKPNYYPYL